VNYYVYDGADFCYIAAQQYYPDVFEKNTVHSRNPLVIDMDVRAIISKNAISTAAGQSSVGCITFKH
jgi:hypothetical protein